MIRVFIAGFALLLASEAFAQELVHEPAPCMDTETFPLIEVRSSASDVGRLSVHFKAEGDPHFYEIALQEVAGSFRAALPRPLVEAVRVVYYVSSTRDDVRTPEHVVNVLMGGCPNARSAPSELTEGIRVRRTFSGQPEMPRGFHEDGIRTGGMTSRSTLGIVGGAAGGAAVAAIALMGEEPPPNIPTPGSPAAVRACFDPDPIPDIESGATLRFDASCTTPVSVSSYQWSFGDGTTAQGTSVEHLFRPGGVYSVILTVRDGQRSDSISRLVRVRATPTSCFTTIPNPPRIFVNDSISFNAECSLGDRDGGAARITLYDWEFGDGRPGTEGRFVSRQFTRPDVYGVTLTVTNADGRVDRTTQFVVVERRASGSKLDVSFTSELELPAGTSAQVTLNDSKTIPTLSPSPHLYRVDARAGENVVDARVLAGAREAGRWRFDFGDSPGFVPGSIRVESGDVLVMEARRIVFRVGESAPPVRFRFHVEE